MSKKVMDHLNPASDNGSPIEMNAPSRHFESATWAVFLIWAGIAMLAEVAWEWFLLGVSVLVLAAQFGRWWLDMKVEGFWVACGAVLLIGALWEVLHLPWRLVPILLIVLGVTSLTKAIVGARR